MKNRLEIARKLLRTDGLIVVQCDDNEQAYLKVLMDGIFGRDNFVGDLIRKTKSTTNDAKTGFNIQHENTLIYALKKSEIHLVGKKKSFDKYRNLDNDPNGAWVSDNPSARSGDYYFPIKNPYTGKVDYPPENSHWRFSERRLADYIKSGKIKFRENHAKNQRGFIFKRYKSEVRSEYNLLGSLEGAENKYMNQVATKERNRLFGEVKFDYPKPEVFLFLLIEATTNPGDLVLDYHLGSGTTCAVAHKTGRRYIGIEQMDYIESIAVRRLKMVINGEQEGGASKEISWSGGGSFIYTELAESMPSFLERVSNADEDACTFLWNELKKSPYTSYRVDFNKEDADLEFEQLTLEDKKQILFNIIDKNMYYIPLSEIDNEDFVISEGDKAMSKMFYSRIA